MYNNIERYFTELVNPKRISMKMSHIYKQNPNV